MPTLNHQLQVFLTSPWPSLFASMAILLLFVWWLISDVLPLFDERERLIVPQVSVRRESAPPLKASLSNLDLFGTLQENTASNKIHEAEQTRLKLTLRGILAVIDNPDQGYAQIEDEKKEERYFSVKDKIFDVATLEEIYVDRVIILHDGKYETLKLPEEFLDNKHFIAARLKQKQKKIATDYRRLLVNRRGMELIKLFGFDTAYKNGSFVGFVVRGLGDKGREMMQTLGIKEGDIVVAVNGENLSKSIQAVNNLSKLKDANKVNVEIDRGGTRLFFDFEFDQAADGATSDAGGSYH